MKTTANAITPAETDPVSGKSPSLFFAVICASLLLAALVAEPYLHPLNLLTALLSWKALSLYGIDAVLKGDLVSVSGFTVRIITECTPLYAWLLYGAFVFSRPAPPWHRLSGLLAGTVVITVVNTARIALVTLIGARAPVYFDVVHVYIGQVVMLLLVIGLALCWQRGWKISGGHLPFLARALIIATLLFIPWLMINVQYVALLDSVVSWFHKLFYPGYLLNTPRPFAIYNHTFAVPFLVALITAVRGITMQRRIIGVIVGIMVIAAWHTLFRTTHVIWTAYHVESMRHLLQAVYLTGQYLLPLLIWMRITAVSVFPKISGRAVVALAGLLLFSGAAPAHALEQSIKVYSSGRSSFSVVGENLQRVAEAELNIIYDDRNQAAPQVNSSVAKLDVQTDSPGAIVIRMTSEKPLSGRVQLASIRLSGKVSSVSGYLKDDKGSSSTPSFVVKNPSDEELAKEAASPSRPRPVPPQPRTVPVTPTSAGPSAFAAPAATSTAARQAAPKKVVPISYKPVEGVLERFRKIHGTAGRDTLSALLKERRSGLSQSPAYALSDGNKSVKLVIRHAGSDADELPQFHIAGGRCIAITPLDDGGWELEVVPHKGAVRTVVTGLSARVMTEYPLVVAPPLELFDASKAEKYLVDYVGMVNELAGGMAVNR